MMRVIATEQVSFNYYILCLVAGEGLEELFSGSLADPKLSEILGRFSGQKKAIFVHPEDAASLLAWAEKDKVASLH